MYLFTVSTTGNSRNRNTWWQCWYCWHFQYAAFVAIIIIIILVPTFTLWKLTSSSSTQVAAGDVVLISSLRRFWYSQAKIQQQPPNRVEQANAIIYIENCASKKRLSQTKFSSHLLPITTPQGLYNLYQHYLLDGSDLVINVTAHSPLLKCVSFQMEMIILNCLLRIQKQK